MKKLYLISLGLLSFLVIFLNDNGYAQLSITTTGINYTIDFDNTVAGVNNEAFAGTGFEPAPISGRLDSDAWASTGMSDGLMTYGDTKISGDYARGSSNGNVLNGTGGFYSFQVTTGNRTLGFQPSSNDFTPGTLTLRIKNNTGLILKSIDLSYLIWVNNDQGWSSSFNFSYSTDSTIFTAIPALDYASPVTAGIGVNWVSVARATTITGLNIASGASFFFRWSSDDVPGGSGSRDELALDDLVINVSDQVVVANPSSFDATAGSPYQINLGWALNDVPTDTVLVAYNSNATFGTPPAGTAYNIGDPITGGGTVLYKGRGTSTAHSGLAPFTTYYYKAWSFTTNHDYSSGVVDNATTYKIEPTDYPTDFTAVPNGIAITVTWTDAGGAFPPDKYLVRISSQDNIAAPVDGVAVADDIHAADGTGALNVLPGVQSATFYFLDQTQMYYFKIFPYVYTGTFIDYKTDGTPPSTNAETRIIINQHNFEDSTFGAWNTISLASPTRNWNVYEGTGAYGTAHYANINGYQISGEDVTEDDWLISPSLDLNSYTNEKLVFFNWWRYGDVTDELKLKYSTDYNGGSPNSATWTELSFAKSSAAQTWAPSGFIDLSAISGSNVHIAFHYLSTFSPRSWSVDEIAITGDGVESPLNFNAAAYSATHVNLSWVLNDAADTVMVAYNTVNEFGTVANGEDYSVGETINGSGTVIYLAEGTTTNHTGLSPNTKYYYKAWSKSDAGDYSGGISDSVSTYKLEPSEYPGNFTATATGIAVALNWTDAGGSQLPDAYLIRISDQDNITDPIEGTPVPDDLNVADGAGDINVANGIEMYTFYRLEQATAYYFRIYPYTNSGAGIDYKTDPPVPSATGETQLIITANDFESNSFGTWTTHSVASNRNWYTSNSGGGAYSTLYYAGINGNGQDVLSNDWLISPEVDLSLFSNEKINFFWWYRYSNVSDELKLKYSSNYTGGDPSSASWTEIPFTITTDSLQWVPAGFIDISGFTEGNVHFAFHYSGSTTPRWWKLDEIAITGDGVANPANFNAAAVSSVQIDLTWDKNINNNNVMIARNTVNQFGVPFPGQIYNTDEPLAGGGTIIYRESDEFYSDSGRDPATKYYYKAWSYNESNIYSDGIVDSVWTFSTEPSGYPEDFTAIANSPVRITVSWTDADATHYLVKGSSAGFNSIVPPIDGIGQNDSLLVKNVEASVQTVLFSGLTPNTTYYFKIFPYNGTGATVNYKTDGTVPEATATTEQLNLNLIISEVTHPKDSILARFVEIHNLGTTNINFDELPYYLCRQANGGIGTSYWASVPLTGTIEPDSNYVLSYLYTNDSIDSMRFFNAYGFMPDKLNNGISGNGNDGYFIYYGANYQTGTLLDSYGIINENGFDKPWFYEFKKAVRKRNVTSPNPTWTAAEWIISEDLAYAKDMTPKYHKGNISWIGAFSTNWNAKGNNWSNLNNPRGYIPDASCNVIIPNATNYPVVNEKCAVNQMEIYSGSAVTVSGTGSLLIVGEE